MTSFSDEPELISKAIAGDLAAIEILLYRHRKRLLAYIESHCPQELRASLETQDILQDTWLKAIRSISGFHATASDSIYPWLVKIARNVMADQIKYLKSTKRNKRQITGATDDENASIVRLLEQLAMYKRTPSKSASSHELMATLDSAIERLPKDQATALRLRYLSGWNVKEVAQTMSRSSGSVSMLCNRALKSLRWEMRSISLYI